MEHVVANEITSKLRSFKIFANHFYVAVIKTADPVENCSDVV